MVNNLTVRVGIPFVLKRFFFLFLVMTEEFHLELSREGADMDEYLCLDTLCGVSFGYTAVKAVTRG